MRLSQVLKPSGHSRPAIVWLLSRPAVTIHAAILVVAISLLHNMPAAAQEKSLWANWGQVQRFRGTATIEYRGRRNWHDSVTTDKADEYEAVTVSFLLERSPSNGNAAGAADWSRVRDVRVAGQSSMSTLTESSVYRLTYSSSSEFDQSLSANADLNLSLDYETGAFRLSLPNSLDEEVPEHWSRSEWSPTSGTDVSSGDNGKRSLTSVVFDGKAPRDIGPLTAAALVQYEAQPDDPGDMSHSTVGSVQLWPEYSDIEVVVYVDGRDLQGRQVSYADWLPEAVRPPYSDTNFRPLDIPGSRLLVKAVLQSVDGGEVDLDVRRFTFKLADTSQEPQVAMNWRNDKHDDIGNFDMRFEKREGIMGPRAQSIVVPPNSTDNGRPSAEAIVGSYDFGGWADLTVEAELADGRVIAGHLSGDKRIVKIPLPRRTPGSHVATAWKEKWGISGADADDNEKEPVGEPGCDGDGLTLYEEYRGFFENSKHFRADPKRKEMFIYNACGAVAKPGIALFQSLTGLKVHQNLLEREFSCESKANALSCDDFTGINANFERGAHRVLQHRVEILVCDATASHGGGTIAGVDNVRLRPKDVLNIYVEGAGYEFWTNQYGVIERDKPRQFDVAMAHELFHTVGGEHHGDNDGSAKFEPRRPGADGVADYHWYMEAAFGGGYARLFDEQSGEDISARTARRVYRDVYPDLDPPAATAEDPEYENAGIGTEAAYPFYIGGPHGAHSGDEDCVMRYWLADLYPVEPNDKLDFYIVPDGTEPVGHGICEGWAGHSINKKGREPQPRYFDANALRGNCKYWVCVNDAIPGVSSELPDE